MSVLTPWNFPHSLNVMKVSDALAAGNTVVLKPSPLTPLAGLALARIIDRAHRHSAGRGQRRHPKRHRGQQDADHRSASRHGQLHRKLSGRSQVMSAAGSNDEANPARVRREVGGHLPRRCRGDRRTAASGSCSTVARCTRGRRASCKADCSSRSGFTTTSSTGSSSWRGSVKVGDPRDPEVQMGPLISREQLDRVEAHVAAALDDGATLAAGGRRPGGLDTGFYFEPTILTDVNADSRIAQEEVFGPVLAVLRYRDDDDAVAIANNSAVRALGVRSGVPTSTAPSPSHAASAPGRSPSTVAYQVMRRSAGSSRAASAAKAGAFQGCAGTWSRRPSESRHDGGAGRLARRRDRRRHRGPVLHEAARRPRCRRHQDRATVRRSPAWLGTVSRRHSRPQPLRPVRVSQCRKARGDSRSRRRRVGRARPDRAGATCWSMDCRPGRWTGWASTCTTLKASRPGLVVVRISDFGQRGPLCRPRRDAADRAGGIGLGQQPGSRPAAGAGRRPDSGVHRRRLRRARCAHGVASSSRRRRSRGRGRRLGARVAVVDAAVPDADGREDAPPRIACQHTSRARCWASFAPPTAGSGSTA